MTSRAEGHLDPQADRRLVRRASVSWQRNRPPPSKSTTTTSIGGLTDPAGGFDEEFTGLARALGESYRGSTEPSPDPGPAPTGTPSLTATTEGKSD